MKTEYALTSCYATEEHEGSCGRYFAAAEYVVKPDGDGWELVGFAATGETLFWTWRRRHAESDGEHHE